MATYRPIRPPTRRELADAAVPVIVLAERFAHLQRLQNLDATRRQAEVADEVIGEFRRALVRLEPFLRAAEEGRRP